MYAESIDLLTATFTPAADISAKKGYPVKLTAARTVNVCTAITDHVIGVLVDYVSGAASVRLQGTVAVVAGGVVAVGNLIGPEAVNGRGVAVASGFYFGIALTAATGAGQSIEVLLVPGSTLDTVDPTAAAAGITVKGLAVADFDASAGVLIGAHGLGVSLPDNAIITRSWYDVLVTFTSATDAGTIALHSEAAGDIVAAVAISAGGNAWDAALHEAKHDGTVAKFTKLTAQRELTATVAVEDLTAGKLRLFVEFVVSL